MRRLLCLACVSLAVPASAAAAPRWGEAPPVQLGAAEVATCLRDAGGGRVAALAERGDRFGGALYAVAGDGLHGDGEVLFGRRIAACPAAAANASGAAVVAAVVQPDGGRLAPRLRVSVRDARGAFAPAVELAAPSGSPALIEPAVAIGADGTIVVAWRERWNLYPPRRERVSVRVVRRPPGARFGAVETLVDRARGGDGELDGAPPAVGVDAAGGATVAWARPRPARWDRRLASVEVAAAAPGAAFARPQRLDVDLVDVQAVALALGPDGRALLAHDGTRDGGERVRVYERGQRGGAFVLGPVAGGGDLAESASRPAVALAPDGGAVVAWRAGDAVHAVARAGPGGFGPVQRLQDQDDTTSWELGVLVDSSSDPAIDDDDGRVGASAAPGGRAAVGWLVERGALRGPASARVAPASGGVFSRAAVVGGPARDVDGVVPWLGAGGLAAVWSDNRTRAFGFALPVGPGRLRLAQAGRPPASPPAPDVRLATRPQALYGADPLIVDADCDAACDLRATIRRPRRDGRPPGVALGTAVRGDVGHVRVRLAPQFGTPIAPPGGGRVRVTVVAAAPGGVESSRAVIEARVHRRPAPAFRPALDVRARRAGDTVVVTWRTAGPARRMRFDLYTRRTRGTEPTLESAFAFRGGGGDRRFRMRIDDARDARWVVLLATARDRPTRFERVVVPVER